MKSFVLPPPLTLFMDDPISLCMNASVRTIIFKMTHYFISPNKRTVALRKKVIIDIPAGESFHVNYDFREQELQRHNNILLNIAFHCPLYKNPTA